HKSVKFCIMAGTAMPRSHRGTGVSPVNDWNRSLCLASHLIPPRVGNRRCTPIHADEPHRTAACIRVHRRFQTTALVPFLFYQSTRPLGRNLTSLLTWQPPSRTSEPPHT